MGNTDNNDCTSGIDSDTKLFHTLDRKYGRGKGYEGYVGFITVENTKIIVQQLEYIGDYKSSFLMDEYRCLL